MATITESFRSEAAKRSPQAPAYATEVVDLILRAAIDLRASDVHAQPTADGLDVRWRIDGVLNPAVVLPASASAKVVARLKVLAELLTYRTDVPQEGRLRETPGDVEMRLSTLPTLYGEKAVVRLFAGSGRYLRLDDLGLPGDIAEGLRVQLGATGGALLFCGPAGSGKTTTLYACLRELVARSEGRRSLATLEDPIEVAVPGTAQSQVNPGVGLTMDVGLRALLRQDPEVIAVGEVRDRATAEVAFQASLTGHLVLSTFHAGSASAAIGRLLDMGIEPYLLRSGLLAVVGQRLVRRLCDCAATGSGEAGTLGLPVASYRTATGCPDCSGTGYQGRLVLAEWLDPTRSGVGRAILDRLELSQIEAAAVTDGLVRLGERACLAVEAGVTSPAEVRRVLGLAGPARP